MTTPAAAILDFERVRFATYPQTGTLAMDLTGRTVTLLVGDLASVSCTVTSTSSALSAFTTGPWPSVLADLAGGDYEYALVVDLGNTTEERTTMLGTYRQVDRPDGTP